MAITLDLTHVESFFTYHTLCAYLAGDYWEPEWDYFTSEDVRSAASKISLGGEAVELTVLEGRALGWAYNEAIEDAPIDLSFEDRRELAGKIYDVVYNNPGEDIPGYGPNWDETREKVLARDDRECRICGVGNEQHENVFGHELHIHHIVPLKMFDNTKDANEFDNLIALCSKCHREADAGKLELPEP